MQTTLKHPKFHYLPVKALDSIKDLLPQAVAEAGEQTAFIYKEGKETHELSYREFYEQTGWLGAALLKLGIRDTHLACASNNRYAWLLSYLTVLQSSSAFVALDGNLPDSELIELLNESDAEAVFYEKKRAPLFHERYRELPKVRVFVNFDGAIDGSELPASLADEAASHGVTFTSLKALLAEGSTLDPAAYRAQTTEPNALKFLVYTSGTTGRAKGVMLSEHNLVASIVNGMKLVRAGTRCLSVLPYYHTYAAVSEILVSLHKHSTICINESLFTVFHNLQLYQPDYIYLVPAFAEAIYRNIMQEVRKTGQEASLNFAIKASRLLRKIGIDLRPRLFKKIRAAFGGRMQKIICGGAPIRPEIGQFFDDIGLTLTGGYGITECSPLVSVNPDEFNDWNTVGVRLPCLEWRFDQPNEEGIGEVLVRGDVVMLGYYKQPELTAKVLRNGWFHTGDYGYLTDKDQLVLTGRKSNLIVLSNGKNVYPEELELRIQNLSSVAEVIVSSPTDEDGYQKHLIATIYPADEARLKQALKDPAEFQAFEEELTSEVHAILAELPSYKHVSQVFLRETPFPKTPSNKIKRQ